MIDTTKHASDFWTEMKPSGPEVATPIPPDAERCAVVCIHRCSLPKGHAGSHWCTGAARPYTI